MTLNSPRISPAAHAHLAECLATCRALGDQAGMALALRELGLIAWWQGDYSAAPATRAVWIVCARDSAKRPLRLRGTKAGRCPWIRRSPMRSATTCNPDHRSPNAEIYSCFQLVCYNPDISHTSAAKRYFSILW